MRPRAWRGLSGIPLALALALALGAGVASVAGGVRPTPADEFLIDVWQTEQGLPQNHVTAITQTRDGYLWVGTYEGLARFDGVRFVTYHAARDPNLQSSRITSLYGDVAGALWIGHEHGQLTRFAGGRFTPVTLAAPPPRGSVVAIGSDGSGETWFLRRNGTAVRARDQLTIASPEGLSLPILCRQSNGPLWRVHAGRMTALPESGPGAGAAPFHRRTNDYIINACASRDGGMWMLTGDRLRKWKIGGEVDAGAPPWGDNPVPRVLESRSGQLWVGTQDRGLYLRQPDGGFIQFNRTNGLPSDWVRSLWEDREGTIWIGTGGGGLCAVRKRRVSMVQAPDGWKGRGLLSVTTGPDGALWAGTEGAGLYEIRAGGFRRFGSEQGLANLFVWSVLDEGTDRTWAGTWGRGLFRRQGGQWLPVPGLDQEGLVVTALHRGASNVLWVGTHRGLARVADHGIDWIGGDLASPEVRCIAGTPDGAIWFGMSGGGLGRWHNGRSTQFRKSEGLPGNDVWSLLPGDRGDLWIGTVGGGLSRWRDGHFAVIGEREGLPNDVVCQIVDDGLSLWLGTRGGIARASKRDLERCADGQAARVPFFTFGKADGLATLECSGGFQPAHCRTVDGRLWFPTSRGLAVIDPGSLVTNGLAPPVLIENLMVGGAPVLSNRTESTRLQIPPTRQRFDFRFTTLSFIAAERARFRYRLEGMDSDWTETIGQRTASYNLIPPGDYVFHVTACNSDGVWNATGASLAFTVLPHYWQTWWFQIAAGLAAAGAVGGSVRIVTRRRYRHKLERMERQRAIERERSRIARDIHDDLGASLTRITLLSQTAGEELGNPEVVGAHLQRIDATARELTKAMEEIVWAVNPTHDTLDSLVTYLGRFAQDLASAAGVRCRIAMPTDLPAWPLTAEVRHNLFLALKEALHNVIRHAVAAEVRVALQLAGRGFTLVVEDDGKGFDPAQSGDGPTRVGGGNGLRNMRRRLEEIGGLCEVESRPGSGTRVKFSVEAGGPLS